MSQLNPLATSFMFSSADLRTTTDDKNQVWFCAKDVCGILGISKYRDAVSTLDDDERVSSNTDTHGGKQAMSFVSESGLYSLIFRSNKPEAKRFRKWVTSEVLPAIRKQGFYGQLTAPVQVQLRYQKIKLLDMLAKNPAPFVVESLKTSLAIVSQQLGEPLPDFALLQQGAQS